MGMIIAYFRNVFQGAFACFQGFSISGGNALVQPGGRSLRMVAEGDRKDFLQVFRKLLFRRKSNLRKTCKRDAAEALPLSARDYCSTLFLSFAAAGGQS